MVEELRWIIDVIIGIAGIVVGFFAKTMQLKVSQTRTKKNTIEVKGNNNNVAGRDINNGKNN